MHSAIAIAPVKPEADAFDFDFVLDRRRPVADQIYESLKAAIVSVKLLPGTSISESRMCRHFGVSRTPVRAAILRLSEEGLINVYPQQGSYVSAIGLSDIRDGHFIRKSLELSILSEAAAQWTTQKSLEARAIVARGADAVAAGDIEAFHEADELFHQAFTVFANHPGVWPAILHAKTRLSRFIHLFGNSERLPIVIEEHLAILDALDAGDADEARARLDYHLDKIFRLFDQVPDPYRPYLTD
ncbi:GntR family transcriptional regulator [Kaistia algarum]|uniref:GntR family transcriptional regulator n=1 Tax=Kaistia algarum TaxID=2083279 RepID=UPI000CE8C9A7|nr:GntR family transcriptional regulator [Kaistia algarum]MCX5515401.1 GntR family transcriptional regulator [Kaistia algarum]PPE78536.1 GntR family transcriptional regulator [Kaistia algarum]